MVERLISDPPYRLSLERKIEAEFRTRPWNDIAADLLKAASGRADAHRAEGRASALPGWIEHVEPASVYGFAKVTGAADRAIKSGTHMQIGMVRQRGLGNVDPGGRCTSGLRIRRQGQSGAGRLSASQERAGEGRVGPGLGEFFRRRSRRRIGSGRDEVVPFGLSGAEQRCGGEGADFLGVGTRQSREGDGWEGQSTGRLRPLRVRYRVERGYHRQAGASGSRDRGFCGSRLASRPRKTRFCSDERGRLGLRRGVGFDFGGEDEPALGAKEPSARRAGDGCCVRRRRGRR